MTCECKVPIAGGSFPVCEWCALRAELAALRERSRLQAEEIILVAKKWTVAEAREVQARSRIEELTKALTKSHEATAILSNHFVEECVVDDEGNCICIDHADLLDERSRKALAPRRDEGPRVWSAAVKAADDAECGVCVDEGWVTDATPCPACNADGAIIYGQRARDEGPRE